MRRPIFYPLIALIAGIIIGDYILIPANVLFVSALLTLIILLISVRKGWTVVSFSLVIIFVLLIGLYNVQTKAYISQNDDHIISKVDQGSLTIEGIVQESKQGLQDKSVLIVQCIRIKQDDSYSPVSGDIRLVIPSDLNFQYGDFIRFHTKVKKIQSFHNPGGFDYERYLNRQLIYASGFVKDRTGIILLRQNTAGTLQLKIELFRSYLKEIIYKNAASPHREIIEAMTIGNQKEIPADVRDNFNKTGTSHILSISGLHIAMVAAVAFFLISFMLKFSEFLILRFNIIKVAAAGAFILVLGYSFIAGMGVTVMRSALMALTFLGALLIGRQRDLYNALFFAGLIILVIAPEALFDISFQLSFSAVLAIIFIVPKFSKQPFELLTFLPAWGQNILREIYIFVLVSIAATIGTLPLIIFYFNRASIITIIANLVTVPLLGIIALVLCMAFILAAFVSPLIAGFFVKAASLFVQISVEIINRLADLSWSSYTFTKPNIAEIIIFYLLIFLLVQYFDRNRAQNIFFKRYPLLIKYFLIICLALTIADGIYLFCKDKFNNDLRITALDVGQGSSTLVRFPHGVNMLIDGGGFPDSSFDMGKLVIAPFLYSERIRKIDIVVLTHPHPDHLQGLIYVVNNFDVREIWCTGLKADDELYRQWEKTINKPGIKIKHVSSQTKPIKINGVAIHTLWPLKPLSEAGNQASYIDTNDSSLVLKIIYGTSSFLFTADISSNTEALLLKSGQNLHANALFVPHHGSVHSSSSAFIRQVGSHYAVISAGKNNIFRHPHPAVLERYEKDEVEIFRTDQAGAITFTTDGKQLTSKTFLKTR